MADPKNPIDPIDPESLDAKDSAFRHSMQEKQALDPEARKWVELDEKANGLAGEVDDLVPTESVWDLEMSLTQARTERDEFRQTWRPGAYEGDAQKQWDKQNEALDENVSRIQKDFTTALQESTPEDLDQLQDQIAQRREELVKTIEERQGIAYLPSEVAQRERGQEDEDGQRTESLTDLQAARRARQEEDDQRLGDGEQEEWAPGQNQPVDEPSLSELRAKRNAAMEQDAEGKKGDAIELSEGDLQPGGRHAYSYSAYATTTDQAAAYKQLEDDQREFAYQNGRAATSDEMVAYQEKNEAKAGQVQAPAAAKQEQMEGAVESKQDQGEKQSLTGASTMAERKAKQEQAQEQAEQMPVPAAVQTQTQQRIQSQGMSM